MMALNFLIIFLGLCGITSILTQTLWGAIAGVVMLGVAAWLEMYVKSEIVGGNKDEDNSRQ